MDDKETLQNNEPEKNEDNLIKNSEEKINENTVDEKPITQSNVDFEKEKDSQNDNQADIEPNNSENAEFKKNIINSDLNGHEISQDGEVFIKRKKMDKGLKVFLWVFGSILALVILFIFSVLSASYLKNKNFDIFSQFNSSKNEDSPTLDLVDKTETEGTMSAEAIYKKIAPSIVGVITYNPGQGLLMSGIGGTGIIMTSDGYIITNAHVIGNSDKLNVTVVIDNKEHPAKVVGYDMRTDLAVLKIDVQGLTPAQFGNSDELNVGEWVLAIGNPGGGIELSNSLTRGIVSALNRSLGLENNPVKYIQTDAPINPGNSGGALVNMYGQVVGINRTKIKDYEALGFAIPINTAKTVVDDIIKNGYVSGRVKIGIVVRTISAYEAQAENVPQGVLITEISKDSSLYQQNVQAGDIITKIDGATLNSRADLYEELFKYKPGDVVTLTLFRLSPISREGSTFEVKVTLLEDKG